VLGRGASRAQAALPWRLHALPPALSNHAPVPPSTLLPATQLGKDEEDASYCEGFALTVFNRADRVDRAGRADKATAMTFYAASYFMEARCRVEGAAVQGVAAVLAVLSRLLLHGGALL
jgi:vacuolar protein sorting-associated protein VTA1